MLRLAPADSSSLLSRKVLVRRSLESASDGGGLGIVKSECMGWLVVNKLLACWLIASCWLRTGCGLLAGFYTLGIDETLSL